MKSLLIVPLVLLGASVTEQVGTPQSTAAATESPSLAPLGAAAKALLAVLEEDERAKLSFAFDDDDKRTLWSNLPAAMVPRHGVRIGDLDAEELQAVHGLLRASTSTQGYLKLSGIIRLDDILAAGKPGAADIGWSSENYWVALYGRPGDARWGWQLSGHHLAANFSVVDGKLSATPMFVAAEPYEVRRGIEAGWRPLPLEIDRAWTLFESLDEEQRQRVHTSTRVPRDVSEGPGRAGALKSYVGLPASDLTLTQTRYFWALVNEYVDNVPAHEAAELRARVRSDGLSKLFFSWAGSTERSKGRFYYRIHGPSLLIEFAVQGGVGRAGAPNHVHAILREPGGDYGAEWLGRELIETPAR